MRLHHAAFARKISISKPWMIVAVASALTICAPARAQVSADDAKVGIVECTPAVLKDHNPGLANGPDQLICFQGYVSNFNTKPRKDRGKNIHVGVPHWVGITSSTCRRRRKR
jgi:hypothetical protein